jgi:saposin
LIVKAYLPQIVTWLENEEPPHTLCTQLSLCSYQDAPKEVVEVEKKRDVEQSPCAVCEIVAQVAENYLENNATVAEIEAKLDQVCNDLPSPYNGECTLIVNSYLSEIIIWLENNETPAEVCQQLSLCPKQAVKRDVEQSPCAVCEIVVQVTENYLENNATVSEIQQKLDQVCGDLPSPYNGECTLIVNAYLPQIIAWLEANEPPATLCAQLSLCSSSQRPAEVKRAIQQSPCSICEIVVQVVENYLKNNASFSEIEAKVDQVCNDFQAPVNGECVLIVAAYLPQIVAWIEANEQPSALCGQLGLCSSSRPMRPVRVI